MKLIETKQHLDILNSKIKEKKHNPRSLSLLTRDRPDGYGTMSHQTIYDHLKAKTDIKYVQLQEYCRILPLPINRIINPSINKLEIILKYDTEKYFFAPRHFSEPLEVIYCLNSFDLKTTYKAVYWPAKFELKPQFSTIDMEHKDLCSTTEGKKLLNNIPSFLHCTNDGNYYYGNVRSFNEDGTCNFQWWMYRFECKKSQLCDLDPDDEKVDFSNMLLAKYRIIKNCNFIAIYPQINLTSLWDESYKIEKISI